MTDSKNRVPMRSGNSPRPAGVDDPPTPTLPDSAGGLTIFRSVLGALLHDRKFVEGHTEKLRSQANQADAMRALIQKRIELALTTSQLSALPELAAYNYEMGKRQRTKDLVLEDLATRTEIANAKQHLINAENQLAWAEYHRNGGTQQPTTAHSTNNSSTSQDPKGLTPAEVKAIAEQFPELTPETINMLVLALGGLLAEKNK